MLLSEITSKGRCAASRSQQASEEKGLLACRKDQDIGYDGHEAAVDKRVIYRSRQHAGRTIIEDRWAAQVADLF